MAILTKNKEVENYRCSTKKETLQRLIESTEEGYECAHCKIPLKRVGGLNVLTEIQKTLDGKINFFPDRGIPIATYACPKCGKVEIFSAKMLGEI